MARAVLSPAVAVILAVTGCRSQPPSSPPSSRALDTEIVAFIPVGEVRRVTEFRWASPVEASRYIVVVRDGGTAEVLRRETAGQQLDIGPELARRFPAGLYNWTVEALDREGRTAATSRMQTFQIR